MKILAVETASKVASVAISEDGKILSSKTICDTRTHSETLLPMIDEVLKGAGISISDIDFFACSEGPGSFTGLRIGVSAIKGLAMATGKMIVGVPTITAMAYAYRNTDYIIVPILDARRSEVYTGIYAAADGMLNRCDADIVCPLTNILKKAVMLSRETGRKIMVTGDGLLTLREEVHVFSDDILCAEGESMYQTAESVALLAESYVKTDGSRVKTPEQFLPVYLRLSQAERERLAQGLSIKPLDQAEVISNTEENGSASQGTNYVFQPLKENELIRSMTIEDVPRIAEMEQAIFSDAWSIGQFYEIFQYAVCNGYVYEKDHRIVGYLIVTEVIDEECIDNLAVLKEERNQGIASALLTLAESEAKKRGFERIFLEVRSKNEKAIRLYEKFGFTAYRKRENYYKDPEDDAICYVKEDLC